MHRSRKKTGVKVPPTKSAGRQGAVVNEYKGIVPSTLRLG